MGKRAVDLLLATVLLIGLAPLGILIGLCIKLSSRGPVFFLQRRVGKDQRVFQIFKLRSMHLPAAPQDRLDPVVGPPAPLQEDERVTRIGRYLRLYSLDELPQLLNVLKGEMSLVGPRPHIPEEVAHYTDWHRDRFIVLPGITGLAQIRGRKNLTVDEIVKLDLDYIENWSLWLDLKILLQTIPTLLLTQGAY